MATGQTLLNIMELLNQELQLQAGETDVVRGLVALNVAQDAFETLASGKGKAFESSIGTVTTTANTESTSFPTGLLRLDRLQTISSSTSRPDGELRPFRRAGGHVVTTGWPLNLFLTGGSGKPKGYWTNGRNIYWSPLPDATYTVRWYGFQSQSDITASGTFGYDDIMMLPLASFSVKLFKIGLDDAAQDVGALAQSAFKSVLDGEFNRDGAAGFEYSEQWTT